MDTSEHQSQPAARFELIERFETKRQFGAPVLVEAFPEPIRPKQPKRGPKPKPATWSDNLPAYLAALENPNTPGHQKESIRQELRRLAWIADGKPLNETTRPRRPEWLK